MKKHKHKFELKSLTNLIKEYRCDCGKVKIRYAKKKTKSKEKRIKKKHKHDMGLSNYWFGLFICDDCQKYFTKKLTYSERDDFFEVKILPNRHQGRKIN